MVERPAEEGLPQVIRILDDSLLNAMSSDEAQDTDAQRVGDGEYIPPSDFPFSHKELDADACQRCAR